MQIKLSKKWQLTLVYFVPITILFAIFTLIIFYAYSSRIENIDKTLSDLSFNFRQTKDVAIFQDPLAEIITEEDWNILSLKEIDQKLQKAGGEPIGDPNDPFYALTPQEIEEKENEIFFLEPNFQEKLHTEDPTYGIISESEWDILSMQEIDQKLQEAGKSSIGDPNDPFYTLTPQEIEEEYGAMAGFNYLSAKQIQEMENMMSLDMLFYILIALLVMILLFSGVAHFFAGKAIEPIEEALKKQKSFVSSSSHELQTPLALIKTEAEVLLRNQNSSLQEYQDFTKNTVADVNYLTRLTRNLLQLAQLDQKKYTMELASISLEKVWKKALRSLNSLLQEKKINIKTSFAPNLKVLGNENAMQQVFCILIDNAIKYSSPHSTIHVEAKSTKKNILINIQDNGCGIPEKDLPYIFDRFYRASEDRHEKGYGLGLAIAKEIMLLQQGHIEMESVERKGTNVTLCFLKNHEKKTKK